MAEQIEKNGARFYRQAAQGAQEGEVSELLQSLAAIEDEHGKLFAKMRANLKKEEIEFNADEQASLYLKAWADGHAFDMKSDPVRRIKDQKNMQGILKVAIELERNLSHFTSALKWRK